MIPEVFSKLSGRSIDSLRVRSHADIESEAWEPISDGTRGLFGED